MTTLAHNTNDPALFIGQVMDNVENNLLLTRKMAVERDERNAIGCALASFRYFSRSRAAHLVTAK
ncbi:MAG: hypothetical protein P4M05_10080 [Bradyrhizobium sp.]|nr:hypothetical protein [Bradyrhizobium sp.]